MDDHQTLYANQKKTVLENLVKIDGILLIMICLVLVLNWVLGGLDVFLTPLESFGIKPNGITVLIYFVVGAFGISLIVVLVSYALARSTWYEIYTDKLIMHGSQMMLFSTKKEVYFDNVVKLSYKEVGFFKQGQITIELTGVKETAVELHYVDNVGQVTVYLQNLIRENSALKQQEIMHEQRINNIFEI